MKTYIVTNINENRGDFTHDEWVKNNSLYFTAVRTIGDLVMKLDGHQPDHWDIVLNQLSFWV